MTLGARVREVREDAGLSQEMLASRSGLHEKHVSEIERGRRDPRFSTIVKLARGLAMPLTALMWEVDG